MSAWISQRLVPVAPDAQRRRAYRRVRRTDYSAMRVRYSQQLTGCRARGQVKRLDWEPCSVHWQQHAEERMEHPDSEPKARRPRVS